MAYTLTVQNGQGQTFNLSNSSNIRIMKIDGLTPAAAEISTIDAVGYDGGQYSNARTGSRNITLQLVPVGNIEESRQSLYPFFSPKKWVRLFFKNANRDVYIDGYVETMEADLFAEMETVDISIICPNPYFIKNETTTYTLTRDSENQLKVELEGFDTESGVEFEISVLRDDLIRDYPIIISNNAFAESIKITKDLTSGMGMGKIIINTQPGEKEVYFQVLNQKTNLINDIYVPMNTEGTARKWVALHPGTNVFLIYVQGYSGNINTVMSATMTAKRYYVGV